MSNSTEGQLSEVLTENQKNFLILYAKIYMHITYKKLTSVKEILDLMESKEFTIEDMFYGLFDQFKLSETLSIYWDDHMEEFSYENYFPEEKRLPEGGAWIKIETNIGYEIHFAKVSGRKLRWKEISEERGKSYISFLKKKTKEAKTFLEGKNLKSETKEKQEIKIKTLQDLYYSAQIKQLVPFKLYEVRIQRTKSTQRYLNPHEYKIVKNIDDFTNAISNKLPGVKLRKIYTSHDSNSVFYMRSRGIPKEIAEMMYNLKQCYFECNRKEMIDAFNETDPVRQIFKSQTA